MSNIEQTLSIIKPDAVERNLVTEIKEIFKNGINLKNRLLLNHITPNKMNYFQLLFKLEQLLALLN